MSRAIDRPAYALNDPTACGTTHVSKFMNDSEQDSAIRDVLLKDLAELLVNSDGTTIRELSNELESSGVFNNLSPKMNEEEAQEHLKELVSMHPWLLHSE